MKRLSKYLKDNESSLISLNEKLVVNKNYSSYTYTPKSFDDLREIIEKRYKEQGPGTEQDPIDFNDIDVSNINSFYNGDIGIFVSIDFEYINISNWNLSNAEDTYAMFWYCTNLNSVGDLSNWDVSKVKDMRYMFYECHNLNSVGNLSKWDVSNVKNMMNMFKNSGIKNIPSWYKV